MALSITCSGQTQPLPAGVDRAHHEQLDAVDLLRQLIRQIRDLRIELVERVHIVRAGALLGELLHLGNGDDGVDLFLGHAQRQSEIGVRVDVGGQNGAPFVGIEPGQCGGQRRLADAAFAGDRYFHWKNLLNSSRK